MRAICWLSNAIIALAAITTWAHAEDQMPWQPNLETARQIAAQTNRLVLIHFWAPRCEPCMRVDKEVFSRAETARALEANFVLVKLNAWDDAPGTARLYGVSTLPTDVIIAPNGRLVSQLQSPAIATQYVAQMNQAAAGYRELLRNAPQQVAAAAPQTSSPSAPPTATTPGTPAPYTAAGTVTPAAAVGPVAPAAATPGVAAADPSAAASSAAAQAAPAQPGAGDRYAEYFRQHPAAAPQNPTPPQSTAPQANAYAAAQPAVNQPSPAPQYAPAAPGNPPVVSPPQASAYGTPGANPPAYGAAAANPAQPQVQLPPGCPPAGLYGYCPVTLVETKQWAQGDKAYGVVHRGRTYLFLGPAEKEKFLGNPERYCPVLSGNDPVLALDSQLVVPGRRETGVFGPDGRVYLFADEASLARFNLNPKRYAAEVIQAMR